MKTLTTVLIRGQFSTGANSKGHFTGWNATGKRIIIPKTMMKETFNVDTQAEWLALKDKPQIHAVFEENVVFNVTDENNQPVMEADGVTPKTFTQDARATAIFKSGKDLALAVNADRKQVIEIEKDFETAVQEAELSETTVNKILAYSSLM